MDLVIGVQVRTPSRRLSRERTNWWYTVVVGRGMGVSSNSQSGRKGRDMRSSTDRKRNEDIKEGDRRED